MMEMLRRVVERGTGRGAALEGFAAGKTGTSQEHRDAWFIGFTDALVAGVWVGNDDNSPMRDVVGGTLPAAIWRAFVREATPLLEAEEMPVAAFASLATEPEEAACDVEACAARYRSFRSSDCTYQPYSGRRRMCPIGNASDPNASPGHTVDRAAGAASALAQARCNVPACARRYRSFDPADCSYQPYGGGARQLCAAQ
jgi:membrane peptidoglycan carboxypeptidase